MEAQLINAPLETLIGFRSKYGVVFTWCKSCPKTAERFTGVTDKGVTILQGIEVAMSSGYTPIFESNGSTVSKI